ncbi:hypothetical protein ERJ75_001660700 [Trypanosoma vivax]|uniref:Uncharacterized protein n=1 Tax=Trypanosoma vivax (strain Y486) TaxID=1055687 RepID=G0U8D6_TRYVY|nr:hypothetical protein TRVL_08835 [Trypanosoma vivax]KAH8604952.1 hypothetical protein ERJ75_001660700 [Trypanosoma vivax]CCC53860.1 conserved hypothetical protein [Trypanosoma vivax Y486]
MSQNVGRVLAPTSSGLQVIQLHSRLVVGIRLHGTIAATHPRVPNQLKCRPFLHYLGRTLQRLQCDVTVFAPVAACSSTGPLSQREFPCEYRVVHDPTAGPVHAGVNNNSLTRGRSRGAAAQCNFQDYLSRIATELHTAPKRILFVDAEINYRFSPVQTVVLEAFEPQRACRRRQPQGDVAVAMEEAREVQRHTERIEAEFASTQGVPGRCRGLHWNRCAPFSSEQSNFAGREMSNEVREAALAARREDYTLVALAGMLVELAAADVAVADFLRVEPLVEKIRVPFHGEVNYLPIENCDDMEQWDWNAVEVREMEVPEVEERDEHRDMFK